MLDRQDHIEKTLNALLPAAELAPARLHTAMRYAVLGGGKRVRPLLAYGAGELSGADERRLDRAAAAVEMIHAYSLVHDDLPCMDNDVLRRGKPTVNSTRRPRCWWGTVCKAWPFKSSPSNQSQMTHGARWR